MDFRHGTPGGLSCLTCRTAREGPIQVSDRGRTIAVLTDPSLLAQPSKPFPKRDRGRLPTSRLDSTRLVAEDRAR